ncbi:YPO3983 family protein [Enterobacteriaceae bacterium LUAb1]
MTYQKYNEPQYKERIIMAALQFPCTIFQTQKRMDDYGAPDMRYGDLSASQLKTDFHLQKVSANIDPWTLTKTSIRHVHPRAYAALNTLSSPEQKVTRQQCARMLFDEFRELSRFPFAIQGPYKHLIKEMISHMQNSDGAPFSSMHLDAALKAHILGDNTDNSSLQRIKKILTENIEWEEKYYPAASIGKIKAIILGGKLPKFDRFQDNFNGMGITVHDTWATHITIKSLHIEHNRYRAVVHYKVQDHFGLDSNDILNSTFHQFHFFRIWFVLQHCNLFGFKPFMTNMDATVEITGERNENKR